MYFIGLLHVTFLEIVAAIHLNVDIVLFDCINISIFCHIVCRIGSERAACIAIAAAVGLVRSSRLTGCPSRCYYTDVHGTTYTENYCENIRASGAAKQYLKCLNNKGGRPSGLLDKLRLSLLIAASTLRALNSTVPIHNHHLA